jgi:hypothetical protein
VPPRRKRKARAGTCVALYEIATGAVSASRSGPPGARLICPALRKKVIAETATTPTDYANELSWRTRRAAAAHLALSRPFDPRARQ